jgi:hypothetical protein
MKCECGKKHVVRDAYTRKNGGKVPCGCIANRGNPGKGFPGPGKGIGKLREGGLSQFGYHSVKEKSELARHRALMRALRGGEPPLSMYRKLNALYVYNRNTDPKASKIFKADRDWIGAKFGYGKK